MSAAGERRPAVGAAALAGLAESVVWFFPVRFLSGVLGGSIEATLPHLALFSLAFTTATAAAARFGGGRGLPVVLLAASLAAGVAEGAWLDTSQPGGLIVAILAALGLGARAGSLGLRDWLEPIRLSFGFGAVALLIETVGSGFAGQAGRPLLGVALPVFFLGSLASRAATVRLSDGWAPGDGRRVGRMLAALGAAMGLAAAFGGAGGMFHALGGLVAPVFGFVFGGLLFVVSQLARPLFWLMSKLSFDFSRLQEALEDLRRNVGDRTAETTAPPEAGLLERVLGLFLIVGLVLALLFAFRRLRGRSFPAGRPPERAAVPVTDVVPMEDDPGREGRRALRRGRVPAEVVRRWYTEVLAAFARLRLPRHPARTPAEFALDVAGAYPAAAPAFAELTAAYERVRYGSLSEDAASLKRLRDARGRLLRDLRSAEPVPEPDAEPG